MSEVAIALLKKLWLPVLVASVIGGLAWGVNHYRDNATEYKNQRDMKTQALSLANSTITDMQTRQRDVAALDAKYTQELADEKNKLDDLQRCVSSGKCGLRLNASCPDVRKITSASSVDDATGPRLTDSAQRDYLILRERISLSQKMISGQQEYIREQCR